MLGIPRSTNNLDARTGNIDGLASSGDGHVVWAALNKDVRQIDRRRVRWVVVRREQVHGHVKGRHRVEGTREDLPVELVGLEHVASDHHKRATLAFSEAGDPADNVELAREYRACSSTERNCLVMPSCQSAACRNFVIRNRPDPWRSA